MKVTYTAPSRAHHYPYARELYKQGSLEAFVSGFSRLSPRAAFPEIGKTLKRRDLFQTLFVLSLKAKIPRPWSDVLNVLSNDYLDHSSYKFAKKSDVFLYYRTTGMRTAERLKKEGKRVMCVLEEVNSHVALCHEIMEQEYLSLKAGTAPAKLPDMDARLQAYDEADYILCSSEWVRRSFLEKGFLAEKLLKNPYGFTLIKPSTSLPGIQEERQDKDSVFRILYVGQLHYRKGLRYLVEAFRKLDHPNKELVIVGPKTAITGLEGITIPSSVRFTGELKGEELMNTYKTASVFCLPSLEEGLALVLGEALSFGLPIVTTNQTGAEDLLRDGVHGWIVPPASAESLLVRIQQLADDPELRKQMGHAAQAQALMLGGWETSGQGLIDILSTTYQEWINQF